MKCHYKEYDPLTSSSAQYHIDITLEPETTQEAFELGVLAVRLRNREIWCATDYDKPSMTMQIRKTNG